MTNKKATFDKKNSRTFKLVPRSPEELETARLEGREISERVFVEVPKGGRYQNAEDDYEDEEIDILNDEEYQFESPSLPGEAVNYGIFYDDRYYDYTRHLKTVGVVPGTVILEAAVKPKDAKPDELVQDMEEMDLDDPDVQQVMEALNDEAYIQEDFEDDLVEKLAAEPSGDDIDMHDEMFEVDSFEREALSDDELIDVEAISDNELHCSDPIKSFDAIRDQLRPEQYRIPQLEEFDSEDAFEEWEQSDPERLKNIETAHSKTAQSASHRSLVINEVQISRRTGRPIVQKETPFREKVEKINYGAARGRNETPEEKKARKSMVKSMKKEKRTSRKQSA